MLKAVAAIDFGTSKCSMVIGRTDSKGGTVVIGTGVTPYAGFRHNEWVEPDQLADVIRKTKRRTERKAHRRIREIYVVIPGEFTSAWLRQVSLIPTGPEGQISREDMGVLYRMAADYDRPPEYQLIHRNLMGASLDGKMHWEDPTGKKCGQVTAYISCISADRLFMESIEEMLGEMGLGVPDFVAEPLSTGRLASESAQPDRTVIVIDTGYFTTSLTVMQNQAVLHHEIIEVGGGHITSDVSIALGVSMYEAEMLKRRNPVGMAAGAGTDRLTMDGMDRKLTIRMDDVRVVMEKRIDELARIAEKSVRKLGLETGKHTDVYLTGGGMALIRGARETVSRVMGTTVHHLAPKAAALSSPVYTSVMGGIHWAIRNHTNPDLSLWGKIKKSIMEFI